MVSNRKKIQNLSGLSFASWFLFSSVVALTLTGCVPSSENEVVVYSALDKEFSEPILTDLAVETGLGIVTKFDTESNKTVGLVNEIIQNQKRPRTDIFWNNEILHTLRLQKLGLLEVYLSPAAKNFPPQFVSASQTWHGFAARARVLIVNKNLIPDPSEYPNSFFDLANPKWKDKCCMARPLFGTTATHAAVLFQTMGEEKAKEFLAAVADNAKIVGGNKQVAIKVARGEFAFGITDTDDAIIEIENAEPVEIVFPDQQEDQLGTLFIPNTICIIKNGPNPGRSKKLVDRLLQEDIEKRLAEGPSAQIPLNSNVTTRSRVEVPDLKVMQVDYQAASELWESASKWLAEIFPVGG